MAPSQQWLLMSIPQIGPDECSSVTVISVFFALHTMVSLSLMVPAVPCCSLRCIEVFGSSFEATAQLLCSWLLPNSPIHPSEQQGTAGTIGGFQLEVACHAHTPDWP